MILEEEPKIIGYPDEVARINGIADSFRNYEEYQAKGVNVPRGLLLSGPAGVGKTLFAKYCAYRCGVEFLPFRPVSGKGARKENDVALMTLFEEAKEKAPCVLFIDEIDRFLPYGYYQSDTNNTFLATILKALDGEEHNGVMVIAATIDADRLPEPLLRSGRMDEQIVLTYPDYDCRKEMIDYYLSKLRVKADVDTKTIAYRTAGFIGADIRNLVNMSARVTLSKGEGHIVMNDILDSLYSIRFKDIRREKTGNEDTETTAVHEVGHLVVGKILCHRSYDVTVDSYDYIKGVTTPTFDDEEDGDEDWSVGNVTRDYYLDQIAMSLAGKAAEEIFLSSCSTGCHADIHKCLDLIEVMFETGMEGFRYIDLHNACEKTEASNALRERWERRAEQIMKKAYRRAKRILKKNKSLFYQLCEMLEDKTVLVCEDSNKVFAEYGY